MNKPPLDRDSVVYEPVLCARCGRKFDRHVHYPEKVLCLRCDPIRLIDWKGPCSTKPTKGATT